MYAPASPISSQYRGPHEAIAQAGKDRSRGTENTSDPDASFECIKPPGDRCCDGLAINTIRLLHSKFLRQGDSILIDRPGRGGRRKAKLSKADEAAFLKQFHDAAEAGKVITVDEIKLAFENLVGHAVNVSSIYRLMARAGWRKIVPRPRHPKKKPDAEEGFKKSIWSPSPPPN